jgi:multiple sugar transport system ATP-binding protein
VAQVVLEDICKSFPARQNRSQPLAVANPSATIALTPASNPAPSASKPASKGSGQVDILRHINLAIADGEFMVLVGPSGCGKSTLLRLIAGLETPTLGNILVDDRCVNTLPPKARDIAMVFQSYALYPHMTVYDNLAFGLRRTRMPKAELVAQVQKVAKMLELDELLQRFPKQLSGGQKQRVALGRAMARDPQVFLMDEPLSNLDAKLRTQTRAQIVQLQRQLGTTTIYVTHDQTEAMTMGDRIAVLNEGAIQQIAAPLELYNHPANRFVAEFIGSPPMNFIEMKVKDALHLRHQNFELSLPEHWGETLRSYTGQSVTLGIRPEHLSLASESPHSLPVQVALVEALGHETCLSCIFDAQDGGKTPFQVRIDPQQVVRNNDRLWLGVDPRHIHLFEVDGAAINPL